MMEKHEYFDAERILDVFYKQNVKCKKDFLLVTEMQGWPVGPRALDCKGPRWAPDHKAQCGLKTRHCPMQMQKIR